MRTYEVNPPVGPLLISEIVVTPTAEEFVEIHNPNAITIELENFYIADYPGYYAVTIGENPPGSSDFRVRFPAGASISAGGYIVVSLESATGFHDTWGFYPDFDLDDADVNAPAMTGEAGASAGLTNSDEMLVLFIWNSPSNLVGDSDYLLYGTTDNAMDKTGVMVGGSTYANETAAGSQDPATAPPSESSLARCNFDEGLETFIGGNGMTGHDETSENLSTTFQVVSPPTPGAPPVCP